MSLSFYIDGRAKRAHRYASVASHTGHTLPSWWCGRKGTTGRSRFLINRVHDTNPISKNRLVDTHTQTVCFLFILKLERHSQYLAQKEGVVHTTSLVVINIRRQQQRRSSKFLNAVCHDGSKRAKTLADRKWRPQA